MTSPVPAFVRLAPRPALVKRNQGVLVFGAVLGLPLLFVPEVAFNLVAIPMVSFALLYAMRQSGSSMVLTVDTIIARAIFRRSHIATQSVVRIVLQSQPGNAFVLTSDGGSAVVTMSENGFELEHERRLRLHEIEMLGRMYEGASFSIVATNDTGRTAMNRKSPSVVWNWIPLAQREIAMVSVVALLGVVGVLV